MCETIGRRDEVGSVWDCATAKYEDEVTYNVVLRLLKDEDGRMTLCIKDEVAKGMSIGWSKGWWWLIKCSEDLWDWRSVGCRELIGSIGGRTIGMSSH